MNDIQNPLSILIVDDRQENIDLLEAALSDTNYEIHTATSGTEGLKLAREIKPNICLLDIMMDDIDGFKVCKQLKENPETAQILIVMITASSEESYKRKALSYGANDFLNKPIDIEALLARLRSLAKISMKIKRNSQYSNHSIVKANLLSFPKNTKLLIIDTHPSEAKHLISILKKEFFEITSYETHEQGLAEISRQSYSAIIVSFYDEKNSAIRFVSQIRSNLVNQNTPLIFLISDKQSEQIPEFLDIGANECIVSPIQDSIELISRCKTCIQYTNYANAIDKEKEELSNSAIYDGLTSLLTRKQFDQAMQNVIDGGNNKNKAPFLALIDIDNFKSVNDTHGHPTGDKVLKKVSNIIKKFAGHNNLVARYGGEEIAIIFPNETTEKVIQINESIRMAVEKTPVTHEALSIQVTISIGFAKLTEKDSPESLLKKADQALYDAKNSGKNKVKFFE